MNTPNSRHMHLKVCLILFCGYYVPLVIAKLFSADVKGVDQVLVDAQLLLILSLYIIAFLFFCAPSILVSRQFIWSHTKDKIPKQILISINIAITTAFVISKIYVYKYIAVDGYAFDTGVMSHPAWTFSIFLSEAVLLMSLMWLTLGNMNFFSVNIFILQLNLIHGTRIYLLIAALIILFIFIKRLSFIKMATIGAGSITLLTFVSYYIFLARHGALNNEVSFELQWIFSPILIESIFSQWSLVNVLKNEAYFDQTSPLNFVFDPVIFSIPRFLFPNKETALLSIDPSISPLGALNGIAASILYLGYLFPLYWLYWGLIGALLLRLAKHSYWFRVLYLVFTFNIVFRLIRDGYIIPSKILLNNTLIVAALFILYNIIYLTKRRERKISSLKINTTQEPDFSEGAIEPRNFGKYG